MGGVVVEYIPEELELSTCCHGGHYNGFDMCCVFNVCFVCYLVPDNVYPLWVVLYKEKIFYFRFVTFRHNTQ